MQWLISQSLYQISEGFDFQTQTLYVRFHILNQLSLYSFRSFIRFPQTKQNLVTSNSTTLFVVIRLLFLSCKLVFSSLFSLSKLQARRFFILILSPKPFVTFQFENCRERKFYRWERWLQSELQMERCYRYFGIVQNVTFHFSRTSLTTFIE